jgi:hypothetical protein
MRVGRRVIFLTGIVPLAACAVLGPVVDADMDHAPYEACVQFVGAPMPDNIATSECLAAQVRPAGGQWGPFTNTLSAGDELLLVPSAAPRCNHGNYTHFVLEGSSDAGAMRIAVPDGFGRGDRGRTFAWHEPRSRWTADNIGTTLHIPAGARVSVSAGQLRLTSACFKSYIHYRIPGERRRHLL